MTTVSSQICKGNQKISISFQLPPQWPLDSPEIQATISNPRFPGINTFQELSHSLKLTLDIYTLDINIFDIGYLHCKHLDIGKNQHQLPASTTRQQHHTSQPPASHPANQLLTLLHCHTHIMAARAQLLVIFLMLSTIGTNCELTESVIFQPVDHIQTSKSSWIFTTAIDFTPYLRTLNSVFNYGSGVRETLVDFTKTFYREDPRYMKLLNMTLDDMTLALDEITNMQFEASNLIGHIQNRSKRSLLPLGGLFGFLFGTADQADLDAVKTDIKQLYQNQMDQTNVLNDIITITNVSRGLINENIKKINNIIDTIISLNQTIHYIRGQLQPLYTARRFMLIHTEFLIHHTRIRTITRQMTNDIELIRSYLSTFTTGKLTPQMIDLTHLRQELLQINKQLPPKITLPEDPTINIWHYYRLLTITPMINGNQLLLMIKIPLLDSDSTMTLYKIHNLPIYNPDIGKSLSYQLEGSNLAVTKDNSYVTILPEAEFIQCTLAQGHFCSLNSALYHIDYSKWCLAAMFLKQNDRINKYCPLSIINITGPQAIYLDQGSWAISIEKPTQMEIRCPPGNTS